MSRGLGIVELVQGALPEGAGGALAAMTQLGDTWFVLLLVALVYWFTDRRRGAFAIGTLLGGLAIVLATKAAFGLPRPPATAQLVIQDGYGFPSGHAVAATVAWGTLALTFDSGSRAQRIAIAGLAIVVVAFTRVALGVHFVVDVIAGVVVGAVYLAVLFRWASGRPSRALAAAVALSAVAVAITGGGRDALSLFGASAGALTAFRAVDVPAEPWRGRDALPGLLVGGIVGSLLLAGYVAVGTPLLAPALGFVGGVAVIGIPAVVIDGRFARRRTVRG